MSVLYKILCEVRVLHEYYLKNSDGKSIFDLPDVQDRLDFLAERSRFDHPSVNGDLAYELPDSARELKDLNIRVTETYSGFKVFARVTEQRVAAGGRTYRPFQPLPDDLPIIIQLLRKNNALDAISNTCVRRTLPAKYYFSNTGPAGSRVFPLLTRNLPLRDDSQQLDQGELSLDPADNSIKAFYFDTNGAKNWLPVASAIPVTQSGYVNKNDHSLVPVSFVYFLGNEDNVHDATFVLKDAGNAVISSIRRNSASALNKIQLDFTTLNPVVLSLTNRGSAPVYTLEVTGDNSYSKIHTIMFCDPELLKSDTWGLVHLQSRPADPRYRLIDDEGFLQSRKNAAGEIVNVPAFEIRTKSRFAFWRYINNQNKKILPNPALDPILSYDTDRGIFETRAMVSSSYLPLSFGTPYLPGPERNSGLSTEKRRINFDIMVPKSKTFDI